MVTSVYGSSGKYFIPNLASAAPNFANGGGLSSTWGYAGPAYGVPVKSKKRSHPAGAIGPMNWL